MRPLPQPDADTAFFWEALRRGELAILRCTSCGRWVHYPKPMCPACGGTTLTPQPVSGRGVVHSYTITHAPVQGFDSPFGVVLVELEEQPGLRVVSNLSGVEPDDIRIGMPVEVVLEKVTDEITLPLFKPREAP